MLKKMLKPFFICLSLSAFLGYALRLLLLYSFFDGSTRLIVLGCLAMLFVATWAAFVAEWRENLRRRRARAAAEQARLEQARQLEEEALRQAAALLKTGSRPAP